MEGGEKFQFLVSGQIRRTAQRRQTKESLIVPSVTIFALPQPKMLHDVRKADLAELPVQIIARLTPKPHESPRPKAGIVQLITEFEAEPGEPLRRALGFGNESLFFRE